MKLCFSIPFQNFDHLMSESRRLCFSSSARSSRSLLFSGEDIDGELTMRTCDFLQLNIWKKWRKKTTPPLPSIARVVATLIETTRSPPVLFTIDVPLPVRMRRILKLASVWRHTFETLLMTMNFLQLQDIQLRLGYLWNKWLQTSN